MAYPTKPDRAISDQKFVQTREQYKAAAASHGSATANYNSNAR